jgi:trans-aconitate 2-methyltransferase
MSWSAANYSAFEDERTRPVRDLVAAIPNSAVRRAIDLGCGPGNSTEVLAARFPAAEISGIDSSDDMVQAARRRLPALQFTLADLTEWADPGPFDVVLSNAVMQWVPDHARLFPRLLRHLAPGGSLAVQVPDNLDEPAHALMRAVAAEAPWADKLGNAAGMRTARASADWYYRLLRPDCARLDVWRTTYFHPLAGGASAVVEWFRSTGLRPFLAPLNADEQAAYLARYQAELALAYPAQPDGSVLLPFPRLFIVATAGG